MNITSMMSLHLLEQLVDHLDYLLDFLTLIFLENFWIIFLIKGIKSRVDNGNFPEIFHGKLSIKSYPTYTGLTCILGNLEIHLDNLDNQFFVELNLPQYFL